MFLLIVQIVCFVIFLLLSAFFSSSETALTSITKLNAKKFREGGGKPSPLDIWLKDPNRILATLLVGNNVANVGASILAAAISQSIFIRMGLPSSNAAPGLVAFVGTLVALLIWGEIIPKIYAKHHAEQVAPRVIGTLNLLYIFPFKPIIAACLWISNAMVRLFGGKASKEGPFLTADDIKMLIEVSEKEGVLEEEEREMIHSIIEFGDIIAKEVMIPRTDMVRLAADTTLEESLETVVAAGHSRIPIYEERIDNIIGILYAKDLLAFWQRAVKQKEPDGGRAQVPELQEKQFDLRALIRPPTFAPETKKVSELLREFKQQRTHMAIVVDEYGGTAGLVTIEDVLEEIVGEIQDEYDREGELYRKIAEGRYEVDARISLCDLENDLGISLPEGEDFETLSGFISVVAGRVPEVGQTVEFENYKMTILEGDERHIERVRIEHISKPKLEPETSQP